MGGARKHGASGAHKHPRPAGHKHPRLRAQQPLKQFRIANSAGQARQRPPPKWAAPLAGFAAANPASLVDPMDCLSRTSTRERSARRSVSHLTVGAVQASTASSRSSRNFMVGVWEVVGNN